MCIRDRYVADALEKVEKFLDEAVVSGVTPLYIIHGHGTGSLKQAVREYLHRTAYVSSYRGGGAYEGGDGISVVNLKT